jgi:hypothetical protein
MTVPGGGRGRLEHREGAGARPGDGVRAVFVPSIRTKAAPGLVDLCAMCSVVVECLQAANAEDDC